MYISPATTCMLLSVRCITSEVVISVMLRLRCGLRTRGHLGTRDDPNHRGSEECWAAASLAAGSGWSIVNVV